MLTVNGSRTEGQILEIHGESSLARIAEDLLWGREARIFPPDEIVWKWQIFVRHSTITTDLHDSFSSAIRELILKLEAERCFSFASLPR